MRVTSLAEEHNSVPSQGTTHDMGTGVLIMRPPRVYGRSRKQKLISNDNSVSPSLMKLLRLETVICVNFSQISTKTG